MESSGMCYSCGGSFPLSALTLCPTCHETLCLDPNCDCDGECRCAITAEKFRKGPVSEPLYPFTVSYVKDMDGKYLAVNNPNEFLDMRVGYTDIEVFGEELAMEAREYDREVIQTGKDVEYLVEVNTAYGKRLWQHVKSCVASLEGNVIVGYCQDITPMLACSNGTVC